MSDLENFVDRIRRWPGIYQVRRAAYDHNFEHKRDNHMFRGVFGSFDEALAAVPDTLPTGYDNPRSAAMYLNQLQVLPRDYPALFWLARSFDEGLRSLVDLGGSVGIKHFAFRRLMPYPQGLDWLVVEVPAVVDKGREFAASQGGGEGLRFASDFAEGDGADLLYASGSLQYLPQTLTELMSQWRSRPRRMIVNAVPLHRERTFYTINAIGTAFCPYRVQSEPSFLSEAAQLGYRLRDRWVDTAKQVALPFSPGHDVPHYSGFCFDREDAAA